MDAPAPNRYTYQIDASDRISRVDEPWLTFARDNDAPHLAASAVVGRPIWDFIDGTYTRHLYEVLFDRVRGGDRTIAIPFNCDSPTLRRFMQLTVRAAGDQSLTFVGEVIRTETTPYLSIHDRRSRRDERMIQMCSFCKAIYLDEHGWAPPEEAIRQMRLFEAPVAPQVSHGVCGDCMSEFTRRLRG